MEKLHIKTAIQVQKTAAEVYEAIVNPAMMSGYFIQTGSARMSEGTTVTWKFPEFDDQVPVRVERLTPDEFVSFSWDIGTESHLVEITLTAADRGSTLVRVTEKESDNNDEGLKWLMGNTEGWANFLACLKAYLEYGINLRKGAFEYMRKEQ